jgi:2-deoxy-D-gluconate 3-dehydrogenase
MENRPEFDLTDRVILISGGAGQIGSEVADAYVSYGAAVVLTDALSEDDMAARADELAARHSGSSVLGLRLDVTSTESVTTAFNTIEARFGRVDVLVNNAAIDAKFDASEELISRSRFEEYPLELWERSMAVNLTGLIRVTQFAVRLMLRQGRGNIINVGSSYGLVSPNQGLYDFGKPEGQTFKPVDYVGSKSTIPNLSRYLATLYARDGIRCNCIAPHAIDNRHDVAFRENFERLSPIGRMCRVSELRGPFVFLASDASSYMTGAVLVVDGGWTAW